MLQNKKHRLIFLVSLLILASCYLGYTHIKKIVYRNMIDKKIIVIGFPHCGTTILKAKIDDTPGTYGYVDETRFITDEMIENAVHENSKNIVVKFPFLPVGLDADTLKNLPQSQSYYSDFTVILIIRDPRYVMSSLKKRFKDKIPKDHGFEKYEQFAKIFHDVYTHPYPNVYAIRYEDMFPDDYKKLKDLFNKLDLPYNEDTFINKDKVHLHDSTVALVTEKPDNTDHERYRTWQINQPFTNMNDPSKLDLNDDLIKEIGQSEIVRLLGY